MRRGEIWTIAGGKDAVILQSDRFNLTDSITMCIFTTDRTDAPLMRLPVAPTATNGPRGESRLMVDKITTVPKTKLGVRIGHLAEPDMARLNRALLVFLGVIDPRG